ncbi:hypothetical protein SAQ01S_07300 [Sphingomonas aquatilis NBRC 16722]|uniref:Uncharacterized protein n=1 Tax=Sphingomonas aquatilis TaxID=93063 RepID=A0AAW3TTU7_9SPHN|nr:hypothetical protein [Sphingomonas aquatilis]MBB3876111.1 hypothetical protein [Sphingomonas aquatilis]GEM70964.1 hypothetical protein SAQ01S_07300 [Sphingomonas aquatilis NBRC 16722]
MTALRKTTETAKVIPIRPDPALADAYRRSITIHYPNSDEFTINTRVELMALRDRACSALRRCGPEAEPILAEAARISTLAALAGVDTRQLAFMRVAVESLIFAADMMRRSQA